MHRWPDARWSPRSTAGAIGVLVVLALALHARLLAGEGLYGAEWNGLLCDPAQWELPHVLALPSGGASWGPYAALGHPIGVFTHPTVHYPPAALLHLGLAPWTAKTVHALGHTLLLGLALLAWLRGRGVSARAATIGAAFGMLSLGHTLWLAYPSRVAALAWSAAALGAADLAGRRGSPRLAVLAGLSLGLALLAAIEQIAYYGVGLSLLLAGPRGRADVRSGLARTAWLLLALGAAFAPRAVPLALEVMDGHRPVGRATALVEWPHLLLALVPDAFGSPLRERTSLLADVHGASQHPYLNYQEVSLYLGLATLALVVAGALRREARGLLALAASCVALTCAPPLAGLVSLLPGIGASPTLRVLPLAQLLFAVVAGHGAAAWLRGEPGPRRVTAGTGIFAVLVALALGAPLRSPPYLALFEASDGAARFATRHLHLAAATPPSAWGMVHAAGERSSLLPPATFLPLALGVGLALAATRRRRPAAALAAVLGLGSFDLLHAGLVYNSTSPPARLQDHAPPEIELARSIAGGERVAWLTPAGLDANHLVSHGLRSVEGYHCMLPARTARLYWALGPRPPLIQVLKPGPLPPMWREALSVRAAVTPRRIPEATAHAMATLDLVAAGPSWIVWADPRALPRARVHPVSAVLSASAPEAALATATRPDFDPRRHVVLEGQGAPPPAGAPLPAPPAPVPAALLVDEAERLVVEVPAEAAAEGGVLVVADAWGRGWSARDGVGRPLELRPAQVALRGVVLPPGFSGSVVLTYRRPGRWEGAALAAVLAAALTACAARRARRRSARRGPAAP